MTPQTQDWFLQKAFEQHKNRFIYTGTKYKNRRTKITVTCRQHGTFTTTPPTHYTSHSGGCKKCGKVREHRLKGSIGNAKYRPNKGSFKAMLRKAKYFDNTLIDKANNVHKNIYTYTLPDKVTNIEKDKFTITCPIHGVFKQTIKNHLNGTKCPKCSRNLKSIDQLKYLLQKRTPGIKVLSTKDFYYNTDFLSITCPVHGDSQVYVYNIIRGLGCSGCAQSSGFQPDKPAYLYYLSINDGQAYKIGITNKTNILDRFPGDIGKITVLKAWEYKNGEECRRQEKRILDTYKAYRYKGTALLNSGNTELFTYDILGLDL